ncbi:MAG: glycosyltransferase family 2 protein [Nitrospirae bacterium]|nr:MAG: glycosyltransferase family 2 protein [Nitrospirota bacterium]
MAKVSVVIPVCNGERYLGEALDSVFAQTFRDYEVICVDDGSMDGSVAIIKGYDERVTLIQQPNAGQGAARNTGVRQGVSAYVAFLDQDDRWYPHKLQQQVVALESDPGAVLAYCNSDRMDYEGRLLQVGATLAENETALESPLGRLTGEGLILPSAMMVRRDTFERVGGFDLMLRGFEDFDLSARLKQQGRFIFLEDSGMCYRVHAEGFCRAGGLHVIQSRARFLDRMRVHYAGDRTKESLINAMQAECYSDWGLQELKAGSRANGRRMLVRSLRCNPLKFRTYTRLFRSLLLLGR